jgi:acetyl-CoA C-acetyltransferase
VGLDVPSVVIAGAARTAFGRFGGNLREVSLPELGRVAVSAALVRAGVSAHDVDEVAIGVNFPGSDRSVARQVALRTGIPQTTNAYTVDRACCSSLTAITLVSRGLRLGETQVAVAGGVDNLSLVPHFLHGARFGTDIGDIVVRDVLVVACPHTGVARAVQAANEAAEFGVTRAEQDEWSLRSHQRWQAAHAAGRFKDELVAVQATVGREPVAVAQDESPRPDTSIERLGKLPTVNGSATVTAGNAPGLSTGASALVLMGSATASTRGVDPIASIVATAMASGDPQRLGSMPALAARKALTCARMDLDDMAVIEINEAFAAVPLISTLVLADGDRKAAERIRDRTNVNGGAVAIGHPTGATAARLVMTAAFELRRRGGGYALITICGGVGEAEAAIIHVNN